MSRNHILTAKPVDKIYTSRYHQHYTYELLFDYKIHWLQVTFLRYVLTTANFEPLSAVIPFLDNGDIVSEELVRWKFASDSCIVEQWAYRLYLTDWVFVWQTKETKKNCYTSWLGLLYPNITGLVLTKRKFLCSQVWRLGIQDQGCSFKRIQRRVTFRPLINDKWISL